MELIISVADDPNVQHQISSKHSKCSGGGDAKRKEKKKEKYLAICVYIEIICDNIKLRGDREQGNDSEVFNPQKVSIKPIFHNKRICT